MAHLIFRTVISIIPFIVVLSTNPQSSLAADWKSYCAQARDAVSRYGKETVLWYARSKGYTQQQIDLTEKVCFPKKK